MSSQQERNDLRRQSLQTEVRKKLQFMERNPLLNIRPSSYSANTKLYPDGQRPFVDKHLDYLTDHPKLDPDQYLANLYLMLKQR